MSAGLRRLTGVGRALAFLTLALVTVVAGQWREAEAAMAQSDSAFDRGDLILSLASARQAAVAYAPGSQAVSRAYERMTAIAAGSEQKGDRATAQRAWRAVRGAATQVRHLWSPFEAERRLASARLARLSEEKEMLPAAGVAPQEGTGAADLGGGLGPLWVFLFLVLCMIGLVWAAWKGFAPDGEWRWSAASFGLLVAATGLTCWLLAVHGSLG